MPYIKQDLREYLLRGNLPSSAGELNYCLTQICRGYLQEADLNNYQGFNDVVGALESCKLEFYRRVVSPYEDKKIIENGDVY